MEITAKMTVQGYEAALRNSNAIAMEITDLAAAAKALPIQSVSAEMPGGDDADREWARKTGEKVVANLRDPILRALKELAVVAGKHAQLSASALLHAAAEHYTFPDLA